MEVFLMKLKNSCVRTLTCTAVVLGAAAMLSVGAFAAGTADLSDPVVAGYLPPQEQMVQGPATVPRRGTPFRATSC